MPSQARFASAVAVADAFADSAAVAVENLASVVGFAAAVDRR